MTLSQRQFNFSTGFMHLSIGFDKMNKIIRIFFKLYILSILQILSNTILELFKKLGFMRDG